VSALSSEFRCRIRPDVFRRYTRDVACNRKEQSENNFAAIQDADQLVPRGFIVINFYQFYVEKVGWLNASRSEGNARSTLLRK
jgi:hypothetical protein